MRRLLVSAGILTVLTASLAGTAWAIGQSVTPGTQTHNHGVASNWTQAWSGTGPFDVAFCPQQSPGPVYCFVSLSNTSLTTKARTYTFYPCVTTTFTQYAWIEDATGSSVTTYATAKEYGGTPC